MGTKLYVGNLNYRSTDDGLHAVFSASGRQVVSVKIITDRETGQSRGFAFVEMATSEDAAGVMDEVNGQVLDGRTLKVTEARDRVPGGGPGGPGGGGGGRGGFGGGGGGFGGGGGPGRGRFGDGGRQTRPVEREYVGGGGHGHGGGHGGHGGPGGPSGGPGGFGAGGRQVPFDPQAATEKSGRRRERREFRGGNAYEREDEEE